MLHMSIDQVLLLASLLLLASILVSKAAERFGIPALALFLGVGMLAGSDGPGGIYFDYPWAAQLVGVSALATILFSAGFDTEWRAVKPVLWQSVSLSTIGVVISALATATFAHFALHWPLQYSLLVGAIISSTDAAAVLNVLRSKGLHIRGRLKDIVEFESGSNDPMAVLLTLVMIRQIQSPTHSILDWLLFLVLQLGVGIALGIAFGYVLIWGINRVRLESEGLYPVLGITAALLIYAATAALHGNGFLAVYLAAIIAGNKQILHRQSLSTFLDGSAWLMQITMFVVLGLQVFPSRLPSITVSGLSVALFLMFVSRPLSVFIGLAFAKLSLRQRLFISWAGLRGAAPIMLATFPLLAGIPNADMIFHVVFFVALSSLLLQGWTIPFAARLLKCAGPTPKKRLSPLSFASPMVSDSNMVELAIPESSPVVGSRILDLHLPPGTLIVLLEREDHFLVPEGSTILQAGDELKILLRKEKETEVRQRLGVSAAAGF